MKYKIYLTKIFGKQIKHNVSPNKTWEGFIGGSLFVVIINNFIGRITPKNKLKEF